MESDSESPLSAISYARPGLTGRRTDPSDLPVIIVALCQLLVGVLVLAAVNTAFPGVPVEGDFSGRLAFFLPPLAMWGFVAATIVVLTGAFRPPDRRRVFYIRGMAGCLICFALVMAGYFVLCHTTVYIRPPGPTTLPVIAHDYRFEFPWRWFGDDEMPLMILRMNVLSVFFAVRIVETKIRSQPREEE